MSDEITSDTSERIDEARDAGQEARIREDRRGNPYMASREWELARAWEEGWDNA